MLDQSRRRLMMKHPATNPIRSTVIGAGSPSGVTDSGVAGSDHKANTTETTTLFMTDSWMNLLTTLNNLATANHAVAISAAA